VLRERKPNGELSDSGVRLLAEAHRSESAQDHASQALCLHCRSPLTAARVAAFCCLGCRNVHALLEASGLDRYYQLRGEQALAPVPAPSQRRDHAWLEALAQQPTRAGSRRLSLDVQGIQCGACVWLIGTLFKRQPGALNLQLNPTLGRLDCVVTSAFALEQFVEQVEEFGYRLGPAQRKAERASDTLLLRTGVCAALAGNTMFLGAATYLGLDQGPLHGLIQNASFATASLSALIGGSYFVERAWTGLRRGVLHLDLPIAVGMGLAYAGSVFSHWFSAGRAAYFDTVSVFIALMLLGRLVQERLIAKNRRQLLENDGASSLIARRLRDQKSEFVACQTLSTGDRLLVCPGEIVPVRARLEADSASCSFDWINGESETHEATRGDELAAGAINVGSNAFEVVALAPFQSSELDLLLRSDDSARQRLSGDFWDRTARIYVVAVLLSTALGMLLWWRQGADLVTMLDVATAVLVVTCPCAFGIAVPLAYELGVAGLRRRGLFVRDAGFFDRAARITSIVFDKTGTLTTGIPALADARVLDTLSRDELVHLYALATRSNHPKSTAVARAIDAHAPDLRVEALATHEVSGKGIEATVAGARYRFGDAGWALGPSTPELHCPVFSRDGQLLVQLELMEVARPDARSELAELTREGYSLWIASGDQTSRVRALAAELGIASHRAFGDLTPENKRNLIESLDRSDTLMLGDGINDGLALSRAHCSGTPAIDRPFVPSRADFYFLTPGLAPVRQALTVARAVRRTVHKALWFAALYNVFAVALSYAGLMRPWLAALLMPGSSIAVLLFTAYALSTRRRIWKS
jgi:P-type Cu2+ transporter